MGLVARLSPICVTPRQCNSNDSAIRTTEQFERQSDPKLFVGLDGLTLRPAHYSNARYPRAQITTMLAATPLMLAGVSSVDSVRIVATPAVQPPH